METILQELTGGLHNPDLLLRVFIRLLAAFILGGVIGWQRERTGKAAGVRTHMLVTMGAALFVLAPISVGMQSDELSRIIQGLATGIGFIGGGAILKLNEAREIEGLTTAAGIWMTAAVGVTVGLGNIGLAVLSVILSWLVLAGLGQLEYRLATNRSVPSPEE